MPAFRLSPGGRARPLRNLVVSALLFAPCSGAFAEDFAVSVGGGATGGRVDCLDGFPCDHHAGYLKVAAAYGGFDPLELQVGYFRVGDLKGADTTPLGTKFGGTFKVSGVGFTAGYRWHVVPDVDLVARGGAAVVRARFAYDAPFAGEPSKTTVQPYGALTLQYALTPQWQVGLDYDLTRLNAHVRRGTLQMVGASLQYHF